MSEQVLSVAIEHISRLPRLLAMGALLAAATGCEQPLEGFLWDNTVQHESYVDCAAYVPYVEFTENVQFRMTFEGEAIGLSVDTELFAQGANNGCQVNYESVVWRDFIEGFEVGWQLQGQAHWRYGSNGSCTELSQEDPDWKGTEDFVVVSSLEPDVLPVGCTVSLTVEGTYAGEAS